MKEIYHLIPINKSAASVVGQKGCSTDNKPTNEQLRENLVKTLKHLQWVLARTPKGFERKRLGKVHQEIQNEINALRPKRKSPGLDRFFIDAAREILPKHQFSIILDLARKKMEDL